jgi:natural product biosynthesis luciferase-like monooxygenase protein
MPLTLILCGDESLTIQCGGMALARGHRIVAVRTAAPAVAAGAAAQGLPVVPPDAPPGPEADWLLSVAWLRRVPPALLASARSGGINFHDGPLPGYAGLNAPVWAILNGEERHAITWHRMTEGLDEGAILAERSFVIEPDDTALTLNTRCYEAALDSFPEVLGLAETGQAGGRPQPAGPRRVFTRADRPAAAGRLDFARPARALADLVRGLDHGAYRNPLAVPKIEAAGRVLAVRAAAVAAGSGVPGSVLAADAAGLVVACGEGALRLTALCDLSGAAVDPASLGPGPLRALAPDEAARLTQAMAPAAAVEAATLAALRALDPAPLGVPATAAPVWVPLPLPLPAMDRGALVGALLAGLARLTGRPGAGVAFTAGPSPAPSYLSDWVPLASAADLARCRKAPGFALDLALREPGMRLPPVPPVALAEGAAPLAGSAVTIDLAAGVLHADTTRLPLAEAQALAARLSRLAAACAADPGADPATLPLLSADEMQALLHARNATLRPYDRSLTIPSAIAAQAARTPGSVALVCEGQSLTYAALMDRAHRIAQTLRGMGVARGARVGLCVARGPEMVAGALGIMAAGAAYVPMDPGYPADRIALYAQDSGCAVIVTQGALAASLPPGAARLLLDSDPRLAAAPALPPPEGPAPDDLAYLIFTSGSTGRPKGVMVEHRNVINFFAGMDDRLGTAPGVWLAVTSLSFDISVLELFWTLARGFTVVLTSEENRALVSGGRIGAGGGMDFGLFYWGNDDGAGPRKYALLLEGARFADANGFTSLWTPERHFHAFGGPYPNPAVTGAAVAAVTRNLAVRAGSCVAPLHHPARIAEDWAVIDNLTNGRAGLAIASGWHPDDFVLRPENTPPANRQAMLDAIGQLRRLWRGEAVEFPTAGGKPFPVVTQPRPVSKDLALWVTTAGNPDTWREAGRLGAHVLTHLLGQSIDEVAGKITLYHAALREAGHDPARHTVTLMLHTFLAPTRDEARRIAEGPMKAYLRAAAALIKQYAWAFPAFKKPQGVANPMDIDLQSLSADETEAILDFAFQRYFDESGLFGTVEDALARVDHLKRIGVGEVACLIDYGIAPEVVLAGLRPLAQVVAQANAGEGPAEGDHSIAAELVRHRVTHLQCTPSMARMLALNEDSRQALAGLKVMMVGGEALPAALATDLRAATPARLLNMYGPTETTIWSTVAEVGAVQGVADIGTPIANTQVYVLDDRLQPVPDGVAAELWIGGDGVARGYWQRPDLTADRFRPDPFVTPDRAAPWGTRMYRTGDLVRWRADGRLDFLGRADHQVKLRGHRIEPGEIEAALERAPGVTQAVVLLREDRAGDPRLVAYVTGTASEAALTAAVGGLPEVWRPSAWVRLAAMPLTPNGKVDRAALPAPAAAAPPPPAAPPAAPPAEPVAMPVAAPGTPADMTAAIAAVWARVLGVPSVGPADNFFALGGHSLLAVQVHRELRALPGIERLTITDIFRFPVLGRLAAHLAGAMQAPATQTAAPASPAPASPPASPPAATAANDPRDEIMARRRALREARERAARHG